MTRPRLPHHLPLLLMAVAAALGAIVIAVLFGSTEIPASEVLRHLFANDGSVGDQIIDRLRLPRALSAFAVGALLALAGALIQILLRNPLGDPYVLGISGGASSAVLIGMLIGIPSAWHAPTATLGASFSALLVFGLAHRGDDWHSERLLLTGVVLAAGWGALISFLLSISDASRLPGMLFWLMGDLADADRPALPLGVLLVGLLAAWLRARDLNIASHGMLQAAALGVDTRRLRLELYFLSAVLTATAVSTAGAIGFIGLITPHLVRRLGATDHRTLLPTAALLGGALLTLADTAARVVVAPMQLPVGVLTALLGVPLFLILLQRETQR